MKQSELRKHFIETLYDNLEGIVSPTPYLELKENDKVDINFLNGKGPLPKPNSTEITILDLDIASLFFDNFNLLYEGVTGVGKTYTSDALFNTVFGQDGNYTIRLGGGLLGASALEPFTTTELVNGIPKTKIDHDKCQKYGALFIDEINRGDSQEVFQVVDGKIHVNGDTGYLRIPIPGTDRFKKLALIAAMNPADGQHSSALELDIAGENRFLKFQYPNGIEEAASSQLDKEDLDLYNKFWEEIRKKTGLKGDWKDIYPLITDSEQIERELGYDSKEFIDVAIGYVSKNPLETFERNCKIMKEGNYIPKFNLVAGNDLERVLEAQKNLKQGFVRRDMRKIHDLSLLLAFIKSIKNRSYEPIVSLNDVAASIAINLESKKITDSPEGQLNNLVNDALHSYRNLCKDLKVPNNYGLRQSVFNAAYYAGLDKGFKEYLNTIQGNIESLNNQTQGIANNVIRSRLASDLVVLDNFSQNYHKEIEKILKSENPDKLFMDLYEDKKSESSIYEHRLKSIIK